MDDTVTVEDKVEEPKVGMRFKTIDEVKEYYRRYGNELGFSTMNRTSRRDDDLNFIYYIFSCNRAGKPEPPKNAWRPVSRTDCKAKLSVAVCPDGQWRVTMFNNDHNHALNPGNSRLHMYPRKRNVDKKLEANDKVTRLPLGEGDTSAMQNYFKKMQANNSDFFYMMDLDDEGRLRNVFWADARSRAAYEEFGDAITFDTSYIANKYDMPLALFLGVNHHGQPILLGCGLLSGEDTDSFTWLFKCWLACMSGCAPKAIITDQGKTMQKAVEKVFPNTRHRWCLWHITKKLPGKLRGNKQYDSIKLEFQDIVFDSLTCDEFEERWNRMIADHCLQNNEWFLALYNERHRWVPIFLKDTFCAGMPSTQRIESMTAFFDGLINSKTTIKQFVEQYESALWKKVQKEKQEDFNSFNSVVPCITHYAMEKQFQDAYTTTKFKEFQHELRGKMYCEMSSVKKDVTYSEYDISEDLKVGEMDKCEIFKVSLKHDDCDIYCSCCLFESRGILCRHAIVVLIHNKILTVPEKFIMQRWRKDLKRCHTKDKISYHYCSGKPEACRFDKMCNNFSEIADMSTDFEDKTMIVMHWINEMKMELKNDQGIWQSSQPTTTMIDGATTIGGNVLPVSQQFKGKQSKVSHPVRKGKCQQKRVGSKRKSSTEDIRMQEFQIIDGEEVGFVDGATAPIKPTSNGAQWRTFSASCGVRSCGHLCFQHHCYCRAVAQSRGRHLRRNQQRDPAVLQRLWYLLVYRPSTVQLP